MMLKGAGVLMGHRGRARDSPALSSGFGATQHSGRSLRSLSKACLIPTWTTGPYLPRCCLSLAKGSMLKPEGPQPPLGTLEVPQLDLYHTLHPSRVEMWQPCTEA